jgi:CelD/BcsL family acetyltransferase involved in cellulose biosynthesis
VGEAYAQFLRLHRLRWHHGGRAFHTAPFLALHQQLLLAGGAGLQPTIHLLQVRGRTIAAQYGFILGGRNWSFQGGWDPQDIALRPGLMIHAASLKWAIETAQLQAYDFLSGDTRYKRELSSATTPLWCLECPGSLRGRVYLWLRQWFVGHRA